MSSRNLINAAQAAPPPKHNPSYVSEMVQDLNLNWCDFCQWRKVARYSPAAGVCVCVCVNCGWGIHEASLPAAGSHEEAAVQLACSITGAVVDSSKGRHLLATIWYSLLWIRVE